MDFHWMATCFGYPTMIRLVGWWDLPGVTKRVNSSGRPRLGRETTKIHNDEKLENFFTKLNTTSMEFEINLPLSELLVSDAFSRWDTRVDGPDLPLGVAGELIFALFRWDNWFLNKMVTYQLLLSSLELTGGTSIRLVGPLSKFCPFPGPAGLTWPWELISF